MMTLSMTIGGRLMDVDGDTKLGLVWDSGLFADGGIKLSRSFGLALETISATWATTHPRCSA